jgi:deoxyribodipyrimidine photolyase-related protein
MIANVYSMVAHSDAGLAMTKPYVSSDNYILKMSNYKKGEWCEDWRALYYNFIGNAKIGNKLYFKENPRTKIMYSHWNKLSNQEQKELINRAKNVLNKL